MDKVVIPFAELKPLIELINEIEGEYKGWHWLIRSDEAQGYFANIHNAGATIVHPCWADCAEEALQGALNSLKESMAGGKKRRYIFDDK